MSSVNDDFIRRMMRGELPTGFEHLSNKELLAATEGPPETPEGDSPEYAIGLLREIASRPFFREACKKAAAHRPDGVR